MEILKRFRDIMASNINAMLDEAEDPEKMIDQYLRDLNSDLGKVKAETAAIMAAEKRERRELDELKQEMDDMQRYAVKALEANNEDDARKFLQRKAELAEKEKTMQTAVEIAAANTTQMRQMHDKLESDIGEQTNLVQQHPKLANELSAKLDAWEKDMESASIEIGR